MLIILEVLQNQFSSLECFNLILNHIDVYLQAPITEKKKNYLVYMI